MDSHHTPSAEPAWVCQTQPRRIARRRRGKWVQPLLLAAIALSVGVIFFLQSNRGGAVAMPEPRAVERPADSSGEMVEQVSRPIAAPPTPTLATAELSQSQVVQQLPADPLYENEVLPPVRSHIDRAVFSQLQQLGIQPAYLCSDAVFLRRVYLDVIGTLPTPDEVQAFLGSTDPEKRERLIEALLERPEFIDYWTMKWGDTLRIKAEFPVNLWPNAAQTYHRWVRTCIQENRPYDQMAQALLTANGSNFRSGAVNFYRAVQKKNPEGIAEVVALTFMGVRSEKWPAQQRADLVRFFSALGYKPTGEWKEEIVYFDPQKMVAGSGQTWVFPDGKSVAIQPGRDPRAIFAEWLTAPSNPWFARALANRMWFWLLGRGVVHEPDDQRADNPPSNPELLKVLEQELVASHFDMKKLMRAILQSSAYQLSSIPRSSHPQAAANFASYPVRRLDAEVLIDALNQITGTAEQYSCSVPEPFTFIPEGERAITLADASLTSPFLEKFSRSSRDTGYATERNNNFTLDQRLHLLNSSHILKKIAQCPKQLNSLYPTEQKPENIIRGLYLMILSRYPGEDEAQAASSLFTAPRAKTNDAAVDLAWALVNSTEFILRH